MFSFRGEMRRTRKHQITNGADTQKSKPQTLSSHCDLSLSLSPQERTSPPIPLSPSSRAKYKSHLSFSLRVPASMADAPASPAGGSHDSGGEQSSHSSAREQDRYLPIANINRIMKKVLPPNGKIAKDAKDTVQECVSEFISFITSEASNKCQKEKRKTINGDDLLWAMATLGFEEYIEPLKAYLNRYREMEGDTKVSVRGLDGSAKNDVVRGQPCPNAQFVHQGSFNEGMNYANSQSQAQHLILHHMQGTTE